MEYSNMKEVRTPMFEYICIIYVITQCQIVILICTICHNRHHILYIVMNETTKFISPMAHVTTFCVRKATFFCNEFHVACICFVTVISRSLSNLNTLHGWREKHFKWGMEWSEVRSSSMLQLCSHLHGWYLHGFLQCLNAPHMYHDFNLHVGLLKKI